MTRDLTKGSILKNIAVFSLPFLLSFFLQTFYGMADLFIVGQFNGTYVSDAVAVGSQFMHFLTMIIVGLSVGSTVAIGHSVGAGDRKRVSVEIGNTITLFIIVAALLTLLMLLLKRPVVSFMQTPPEAVEECVAYLTICFSGIPFIVAYNIISSIFRGMGNSRVPLYFVACACVLNIGLDYLFIGGFGMGARGAAFGTILSQLGSVIISVIYILKNKSFEVTLQEMKPSRDVMGKIFSNGIPIAAQETFIQASFLVLTIIANTRGITDSTAVGIVEKAMSILFMVPSSMLSSVSVIGSHCIGAGNLPRAKTTLKYAMMIVWIYGLIISGIILFKADNVVGIFTSDADVIKMGGQYMRGYIWDVMIAGTHFCFSGFFTACNKAKLSFLHNVISTLCGRIPLAFLMSAMFATTLFPMGLAVSMGSSISIVICVIAYIWLNRHPEKIGISD